DDRNLERMGAQPLSSPRDDREHHHELEREDEPGCPVQDLCNGTPRLARRARLERDRGHDQQRGHDDRPLEQPLEPFDTLVHDGLFRRRKGYAYRRQITICRSANSTTPNQSRFSSTITAYACAARALTSSAVSSFSMRTRTSSRRSPARRNRSA